MILTLDDAGRATLAQLHDFGRFHCEIGPAHATPEAAQAAFAGLAELPSRDTAWVDMAGFYRLGAQLAGADAAGWRDRAEAMVGQAARHGWVREQPPAIKSHIVWRA